MCWEGKIKDESLPKAHEPWHLNLKKQRSWMLHTPVCVTSSKSSNCMSSFPSVMCENLSFYYSRTQNYWLKKSLCTIMLALYALNEENKPAVDMSSYMLPLVPWMQSFYFTLLSNIVNPYWVFLLPAPHFDSISDTPHAAWSTFTNKTFALKGRMSRILIKHNGQTHTK